MVTDELCATRQAARQTEKENAQLREFVALLVTAGEAMLGRSLELFRRVDNYFREPEKHLLDPRRFYAEHSSGLFAEWREVFFDFKDSMGKFPDAIPEARMAYELKAIRAEMPGLIDTVLGYPATCRERDENELCSGCCVRDGGPAAELNCMRDRRMLAEWGDRLRNGG